MANIFLSYARNDDEPFVKRLYQHLSLAGFPVWFDRVSMPSRSLTFLQEIRDEIHNSRQLILIIGPNALHSDYVRAEWHHALAEAKVVIPVLRMGKFEDLPPELNKLHCPDARESDKKTEDDFYTEISRILKEPIAPLAMVVGGAPDLPPHFQPRPEELTAIATTVFFDLENPIDLQASEKIILMHGMGGAGKTVLAAAFARYTTTRRVFMDGIFWLSANEDLSPLAICNKLGQLLTGFPQNWQDTEATIKLKELLRGKRCLLVMDNIWFVKQVAVIFNCLDLNTRVLLTTRDAGLIASTGARSVNILELSKEASLRQLADWLHITMDELPDIADELVKECGYLPFALSLNGAMLAEGMPWQELLTQLQSAQIDFAEKEFLNYDYATVLKSIQVSVDVLVRSDATAAVRFSELAAFNWSNGVTAAAVALLWEHCAGMPKAISRKLLGKLENKSLLRLKDKTGECRIFFHDLVLDYLRLTTKDQQELNKKLLAAYKKISLPDWPGGPTDGYFHQNLVSHLLKAGEADEVHRLFSIETTQGLNAWYIANELIDNIDGYLADINRVTAQEQGNVADAASLTRELKYQCHYGLITGSLRSLAGTLPSALRVALLRNGIWNEGRAIAEAGQVEDIEKRFFALITLLPLLKEPLRSKVIKDVLLIAGRFRGNDHNLFAEIVPFLEGAEQKEVIARAAIFALKISGESYAAKAFAKIITVLPQEDIRAYMATALALLAREVNAADVNHFGFESVRILAPYVNSQEMLSIIELVRKIPHQFSKAIAFTGILPYTDPDMREALAREGLTVQSMIEGNSDWVYMALSRFLPGVSFDALFDEIVARDKRQVAYLVSLLPEPMSAGEIEKWMSRITTLHFDNESNRIDAYIALVPKLPKDRQTDLIQYLCGEVPKLEYHSWKEEAYTKMASWLDAKQLIGMKSVLLSISDQSDMGYAFLNLFDYLDDPGRKSVYDFFLSSVKPSSYLDLYIQLAKKLPASEKEVLLAKSYEALQAGASMTGGTMSGNVREEVLSDFATIAPPQWQPVIINTALNWIFSLPGIPNLSAEKFVTIISHLSRDTIEKGSIILIENAIKNAEEQVTQANSGALADNYRVVAKTVKILAPYMNEQFIQEATRMARSMPDYRSGIITLICLAPYMTAIDKAAAVQEAFIAQKEFDLYISDPGQSFCDALVALSDLLEGEEKREVLLRAVTSARSIDSSWRWYRLIDLAKRLGLTERLPVLEEALPLAMPWNIVEICRLMPPGNIPAALADKIIDDVKQWGGSLTSNLPYYIEHTDRQWQYELWKRIQPALFSLNRKDMSKRLGNCVSLIVALGGQECVNEISQSLLTISRWWR